MLLVWTIIGLQVVHLYNSLQTVCCKYVPPGCIIFIPYPLALIGRRLAVLQGRFMLSVNQEFVERDQLVELHNGDEIAIIPPISGG